MGINIWNKLTVGIEPVFKMPKRKLWFECIPGVMAFPAVTFGRKRKLWFRKTEYLILYRDNTYKESRCHIAWVPVSQLIDREASKFIDKSFDHYSQTMPSFKDAVLNTHYNGRN